MGSGERTWAAYLDVIELVQPLVLGRVARRVDGRVAVGEQVVQPSKDPYHRLPTRRLAALERVDGGLARLGEALEDHLHQVVGDAEQARLVVFLRRRGRHVSSGNAGAHKGGWGGT